MTTGTWGYWAVLSAVFAALTAIFAKLGVQGGERRSRHVDPNDRHRDRTAWFRSAHRPMGQPLELSARTWVFLVLSALATGASWICYFRALQLGDVSKVAPVDKLSVILIALFAFLGERPSARDWTGILLVGAGVLILLVRR